MRLSGLSLVAGVLVGVATAAGVGLVAGVVLNGIGSGSAWAALLIGLGVAGAVLQATGNNKAQPGGPITVWQAGMLFVFGLAALRSFLWLVYTSGPNLMVGSPFNLGDMALHLHLIHYLASGVSFWPDNSIFIEGWLRYPVGMDWFNAILLAAGVPVLPGLVWAGLGGSALTAFALLRWGGAFALAAFLFNGGLVGFAALAHGNPGEILHGVEWKNLFLTIFVTQRGFLWALPAGLLLFCAWRDRLEGRKTALPQWVEVALYASLPLFHLHTFLFLSVLLAAAWLSAPDRVSRWAFFWTGAAAFLPASVLVWLVTGGFSVSGAVGWAPGWMQGDKGPWFWWENFGISLLLLAVLGGEVARRGSRTERVFVGVALTVLVACGLFRFAPWPWDNIKLMLWSWLACAPFLWRCLLQPLHAAPRAGLILLLFLSGAFALAEGLSMRHRYALLPRGELAHGAAMVKTAGPAARFAVAPDYAHPIFISGGKLAMGFPGHLWSHGYDYGAVETALRELFVNPSAGAANALLTPVTHVFVGPRERATYGQDIWQNAPPGWSLISSRGGARLFERLDARD